MLKQVKCSYNTRWYRCVTTSTNVIKGVFHYLKPSWVTEKCYHARDLCLAQLIYSDTDFLPYF